jgi:hypothetical protein
MEEFHENPLGLAKKSGVFFSVDDTVGFVFFVPSIAIWEYPAKHILC